MLQAGNAASGRMPHLGMVPQLEGETVPRGTCLLPKRRAAWGMGMLIQELALPPEHCGAPPTITPTPSPLPPPQQAHHK